MPNNNFFKRGTRLNEGQVKKIAAYWKADAVNDFKVAQTLFERKFYAHCLFFCHLTVEKLLKALVVARIKRTSTFTHDLRRLSQNAQLEMDAQKAKVLDELFAFNIAGRYPDEKIKFYKKHNKKEVAQKYLKITKDLIQWLNKELQKK